MPLRNETNLAFMAETPVLLIVRDNPIRQLLAELMSCEVIYNSVHVFKRRPNYNLSTIAETDKRMNSAFIIWV